MKKISLTLLILLLAVLLLPISVSADEFVPGEDTGKPGDGHTYELQQDKSKAPTCNEGGYEYYECIYHSDVHYIVVLPAVGHNYQKVSTTNATHLKAGKIVYVCKNCGDTYTVTIPKLTKHTYVSKVVTEATCEHEGLIKYTCACGDSYTKTIAKLPHEFETVTTPSTCTQQGKVEHICKVCGNVELVETLPLIPHEYEAVETKKATYFHTGLMTYTCKVCGDSYTATIPVKETDKNTVIAINSVLIGGIAIELSTFGFFIFSDIKVLKWYNKKKKEIAAERAAGEKGN